jgi:hypothetical protein
MSLARIAAAIFHLLGLHGAAVEEKLLPKRVQKKGANKTHQQDLLLSRKSHLPSSVHKTHFSRKAPRGG